MDTWRWVAVAAVVAGLASGPASLDSAAAAEPPLDWNAVLFAFVGSTIGMIFVVGIQVMRREDKYARWAFRFMGLVAAYIAASGMSALAFALYASRHSPAAWLFLACGVGAMLGLWICRAFKRRHDTVAP
jgi:uncharacterized membrane protein YeaQ/YmgE (transglycosylase-associated protein family)